MTYWFGWFLGWWQGTRVRAEGLEFTMPENRLHVTMVDDG